MSAHSIPVLSRRRVKAAAVIAAATVAFAIGLAAWGGVMWMSGGNQWAAIAGAVVVTGAFLAATRWAMDPPGDRDDMPPCLALVGSRLQMTGPGGQLRNVASMCGDCQLKMGATSPLRACPRIEAARATRTGARS